MTELPEIEFIKSPNYYARRGVKRRMIVLHYTASDDDRAINTFLDRKEEVSAHYVIKRNGKIVQMVDLKYAAWHAGQHGDRGEKIKPNRSSVGIEIVNWGELFRVNNGFRTWIYLDEDIRGQGPTIPNDQVIDLDGRYWHKYNDAQIDTVADLVAWLCRKYGIEHRFMFKGQSGFTRLGREYETVPYYLPSGSIGTNSRLAIWRFKDNEGICGHCHISTGKDDPGPHLDWDKIVNP